MRVKHFAIVFILLSFFGIPYFLSLKNQTAISQLTIPENYNFDKNNLKFAGDNKGDGLGDIDTAEHHMFWFVQITDTQHIWYNNESMSLFRNLLSETRSIIEPEFFVHTGDIVDSDYEHTFGKNERDQRIEEWQN